MITDINDLSNLTSAISKHGLAELYEGITTPSERSELTKRLQIIEFVKAGVSQHEIAKNLGIEIATVSRGYQAEKRGKFDGLFECLPMEKASDLHFGDSTLPRIFKGCWQLSGGHGTIAESQAISDMIAYAEAGIYVFDTGDIYGDSESMIGKFLQQYRKDYGDEKAEKIRVHTKFVPDLNALEDLTYEDVETIIHRSRKRLGLEALDLVQFHWWDFSKGDFVQAARWLQSLKDKGYIKQIGLTNFDCKHTQRLLDADIDISSNQIQFSLFDPRGFNGMLTMAQKYNVEIFCYGVLAGGLLESPADSTNRSHIKYSLVIDEVGQIYYRKAIETLEELAQKYRTSRSNIALAYALQTQGISAVIVGPRNTRHLESIAYIPTLEIDDYLSLRSMQAHLQNLTEDDIYSYERISEGPHAKIMKYNQNNMRP